MDRFWLVTWTTYGTWLPGDQRGFVGPIQDKASGTQRIENRPQTPYLKDLEQLRQFSQSHLKSKPIFLVEAQAKEICGQFHETADHRNWNLLAIAIMRSHIHQVVGVPGDPDPDDLLRDFKSYASRRLNQKWTKLECGTWWTESGSVRKLPDESAVRAAIEYVRNQDNPLLVEVDEVLCLNFLG
jgi:REP element-mobilizing transposase RayT